MRRISVLTSIIIALLNLSAAGREIGRETAGDETCPEPVYERKEVSRPARFRLPVVSMTDEARANIRRGTVSLTAVLCREGRVTDIVVVKGLPHRMTERVVEAVRGMKFIPAEKGGQAVSQKARMEFHFNVF